jgi:hypothetical protein
MSRKEQTMTWDAHHRRGEVLRAVIDEANARRDGALPMGLPGVDRTFADDFDLIAALQLRWHTRLAGCIERALMEQPMDLESAVLNGWRAAALELGGVRAILDAYTETPTSAKMDAALGRARQKEWMLLAAMAGKASANDPRGAHVGRRLEEKARASYHPVLTVAARHRAPERASGSLFGRLRARLAA